MKFWNHDVKQYCLFHFPHVKCFIFFLLRLPKFLFKRSLIIYNTIISEERRSDAISRLLRLTNTLRLFGREIATHRVALSHVVASLVFTFERVSSGWSRLKIDDEIRLLIAGLAKCEVERWLVFVQNKGNPASPTPTLLTLHR